MSSEIAIKVENLSKCYQIYEQPHHRLKQFILPRLQVMTGQRSKQYFREFWALKDVSFEVKKGETVGIIGRNGSGKSTLLRMICGTLNPTGGGIQTEGRIAALLELGSGFNPEFTGRENIYMSCALLGLSKEEVDRRFDDIAAFADIGDFIEEPVKTYSSGMFVRLAFAVNVISSPDIMVVDEALAVGDVAFQFKCLERLKLLVEKGTSILFVSHDMSMIKSFCSRAVYLENGKTKASGLPEDVTELYALDMRDEMRRNANHPERVTMKTFIGDQNGIAFGTNEGFILSAEFTNTNSHMSQYIQGEKIEITVKIKVRPFIGNPNLSVIIQDRRMLDIGGQFFPLKNFKVSGGWLYSDVQIFWLASFSGGSYGVTIRLENRKGHRHFFPLDKQVGILNYSIIENNQTFLGVANIDMQITELLV